MSLNNDRTISTKLAESSSPSASSCLYLYSILKIQSKLGTERKTVGGGLVPLAAVAPSAEALAAEVRQTAPK